MTAKAHSWVQAIRPRIGARRRTSSAAYPAEALADHIPCRRIGLGGSNHASRSSWLGGVRVSPSRQSPQPRICPSRSRRINLLASERLQVYPRYHRLEGDFAQRRRLPEELVPVVREEDLMKGRFGLRQPGIRPRAMWTLKTSKWSVRAWGCLPESSRVAVPGRADTAGRDRLGLNEKQR